MDSRNSQSKQIDTLPYDTDQAVIVFDQLLEKKLRDKPDTLRAMASTVFKDVLQEHRTYGVALATAVGSLDGFLDESDTFNSVENDYWSTVRASDEGTALAGMSTDSLGASYRQDESEPFWLRDTRSEKDASEGRSRAPSGQKARSKSQPKSQSESVDVSMTENEDDDTNKSEKEGNVWHATQFNQASSIFHTMTDTAILRLFKADQANNSIEHRLNEALRDRPDKYDISFAKGGRRATDYFVEKMDEFTRRWGKSVEDPSTESGRRNNVNHQVDCTLYDTTAYMKQKSRGIQPLISKRIDLNPRPHDAANIFSAVMEALESAGVSAHCKISDIEEYPKHYAERKADYNSGKIRFSTKKEMIVLRVTEEEADTVLGIVKDIYDQNTKAFEGRSTPWVPVRINDGISVGDDIGRNGEFTTSHRAKVVGQALEASETYMDENGIDKSGLTDKEKIVIFRATLSSLLEENDINPRNIAFNAGTSGTKRSNSKKL